MIGICYWWGWVLGKRRFWRHECLTHFQTDAVCIRLDDGPSFLRWYQLPALDWYPFVSRRLASRFFDAASERDHCLAGLANRAERPSDRLRLSRLPLSIPTEGRKGCRGKREKVSFMNKEMSLFVCQTEFLHQVSEKSNGTNSRMQIAVLISASDCFWSSLSSEAKMIDGIFFYQQCAVWIHLSLPLKRVETKQYDSTCLEKKTRKSNKTSLLSSPTEKWQTQVIRTDLRWATIVTIQPKVYFKEDFNIQLPEK